MQFIPTLILHTSVDVLPNWICLNEACCMHILNKVKHEQGVLQIFGLPDQFLQKLLLQNKHKNNLVWNQQKVLTSILVYVWKQLLIVECYIHSYHTVKKLIEIALAAWRRGHRIRLRNRRPGFESRQGVRFLGKS
jgi:hypothetical protein